jgi:Leucine-rich repeat (LRR) protein
MMKKKLFAALALVCVMLLVFAGCDSKPGDDPKKVRELTMVVDADSISQLEQYTQLVKVDLTGSTCYRELAAYAAAHPNVEVIYTVSVGEVQVSSTRTDVTLTDGSYEFSTLLENLQYLPKVKTLSLPATRLNAVQLEALRKAYPNVDISCTIRLNGVELNADTTELNLSAITPDQVDAYAEKLSLLPKLQKVELLDADGKCALELSDVKKLQAAAPDAVFNFTFDLFGQTISTSAERVEFVNVQIGNEGEAAIRDALDMLPNCTYFLLDNCGLDNEVIAGIRDDYPDTKVVWRIFQTNKNRSWLTDTEVLRAVYGINDENSGPLKYLTEVKYMDLGHNTSMVDLSFCAYMPNLEIAILSGSPIKDLSPLANCKKLEFLEIAWCGHLTDVSPLAGCESLKYLNIGHTSIKNVETLKDLPLELLSFVNSGNKVGMTEAKWKEIQNLMPDCWITYTPLKDNNAFPYGSGWRYKSDKYYASNFTDCYKKVREVFDYDAIDQVIAGGNSSVPTGNAAVKTITKVVTAETISELDQYPNLQEANLTGSTCYEAILKYIQSHPKVTVTFTVSLGGSTTVKNTTKELSVSHGSYDYDVLCQNLKYVTALKNLTFPSTSLSADQISALKAAYPNVGVKYTMATQGTEIGADIQAVDLSAVTADQVDATIAQLNAYPNVVWVELMKSSGGSNLSISDVKKLQTACPNVIFHYSFTLFDKTVSTTDAKVEFVNKSIGNGGESKIREALDILSACTYFKLDNCGLDYEVLAKIRDDYPNTKVVWRIYQPNKTSRSWLTDTEVLRAVYHVNDSNSHLFKYLTEVKYMDLGHNTSMVDLSFCAYMPNLEIAILSGAPIKDLTPLSNCKKLEFLEIAWCGHVKDISPLAGCDSLKHLNVSHTQVKDFTALKHLKLEMLCYVNSGNRAGLTAEYWAGVQAMFPDCWITYNPLRDNEANPYSVGWRLKSTGGYTPIYRKVRDVFGYDEIDKVLQSQK